MNDGTEFCCDGEGCMNVWFVIGPAPERCPLCDSTDVREIDFDKELETTDEPR